MLRLFPRLSRLLVPLLAPTYSPFKLVGAQSEHTPVRAHRESSASVRYKWSIVLNDVSQLALQQPDRSVRPRSAIGLGDPVL